MATYSGGFSGRPYTLRLIITTNTQDDANNRSKVNYSVEVRSDAGYGSYYLDGLSVSININGTNYTLSRGSLDFRPDYTGKTLSFGSGVSNWIGHGSDGRKTISVSASASFGYPMYSASSSGSYTLARIPKTPSKPRNLATGATTPTTVALDWDAPSDDGGDSVDGYTIQYDSGGSGFPSPATTPASATDKTITGLTPGLTYWFRTRAYNGVGNGAWSDTVSASVGLPAPTLTNWAQDDTGGLAATWTAPAETTGLTGYRVTIATDIQFTQNVIHVDLGNVLTYTRTGLAGGRRYWVKVAARTAGGVNAYSASLDTLLILDAGNLDGWTRRGATPVGISGFTAEGLRRGATSGEQALYVESLATSAATVPTGVGIERTVTGLTPGSSYRFEATMTGAFTTAPTSAHGSTYALVVDATTGDPETLPSATGSVELPALEFVAASTTAVLAIVLDADIIVPGAQDQVEQVAFHGIQLLELDTDYPQRLRDTVYESNLANHFDLACNSVGASWYVAKDGVTRFRLPGAGLPVSAEFTDTRSPGALEYVDIVAGYDTRSTVNRLEATNYGETGGNEDNDTIIVEDPTSQARYGVLRATLDVNLYDEDPYQDALAERLDAVLQAHDEPELFVSQIRWNAQQNLPMAAILDVGQRILVNYRGTPQDSQIVSINHDIQPRRWMVTLNLRKI